LHSIKINIEFYIVYDMLSAYNLIILMVAFMLHKFLSILTVGMMICGVSLADDLSDGHLLPGRYAGFLNLNDDSLKIPVILDTVYIPATKNEAPKLAAYFKISFGSFYSHEYLTHVYMVSDHDWTSPETILDAVTSDMAHDLTLNLHSSQSGKRLSGKAKSRRGSMNNAEIELIFWNPGAGVQGATGNHWFASEEVDGLFSSVPVFPALTGTYRSECSDAREIQFEVTKKGLLSNANGSPVEGFVLRGRVYSDVNLGGVPTPMLTSTLSNAEDFQYNFYQGSLNFPHLDAGGVCQRTKDSIECGRCSFKAAAEDKPFLDALIHRGGLDIAPTLPLPTENSEVISPKTLSTQIAGVQYRGHIQFEQRNVIRPFSIDLNVAGRPRAGDPTIENRLITLIPQIHLQALENTTVWQQFAPIDLNAISVANSEYPKVIAGSGGDVLKVDRWTVDSISGVYYAAGFGRLGTFAVYRDFATIPKLQVEFTIPGSFLTEPVAADEGNWAQSQLNLEWIMSPSGGSQFMIGGAKVVLWNVVRDNFADNNTLGTSHLLNARFDPYSGVLGYDLGETQKSASAIGILGKGVIEFVESGNQVLDPYNPFHKIQTASRTTPYKTPDLPRSDSFEAGHLIAMLPFDAKLFANGARLPNLNRSNVRQFNWPAATSGRHDFTLRAEFATGKIIEHKISISVEEASRVPYVVNFYDLQH
jgi:hypothetical protein